jgi:hypothetical protein
MSNLGINKETFEQRLAQNPRGIQNKPLGFLERARTEDKLPAPTDVSTKRYSELFTSKEVTAPESLVKPEVREDSTFILTNPTEPLFVASFVDFNSNGQPNYGFHKWKIDQAIRAEVNQPAPENSKEIHPLSKAVIELTTSPYARPITMDEYKKLSPEQQKGLQIFLELKPFDVNAPRLVAVRLPISVGERVFDMPYQLREKRENEMFVMDILTRRNPRTKELEIMVAAGTESELETLAVEDDKNERIEAAFVEKVRLNGKELNVALTQTIRLLCNRIMNVGWNVEKHKPTVSEENITKATEMIQALFKTEVLQEPLILENVIAQDIPSIIPAETVTLDDLQQIEAAEQAKAETAETERRQQILNLVASVEQAKIAEQEAIKLQQKLNIEKAIAKLKPKPKQ